MANEALYVEHVMAMTVMELFAILVIFHAIDSVRCGYPKTLVVGFDGFRWDLQERLNLPNFARIANEGVRARTGMTPVFPSLTTPNYWSINTGLYPETHGAIHDFFYDSTINDYFSVLNDSNLFDPKWFVGDAIWIAARNKDNFKRVVANNWPFSWIQRGHQLGPELLVRQLSLTDNLHKHYTIDRFIKRIDWAIERLLEERADLVLVYFNEPDVSLLNYGFLSEKMNSITRAMDTEIGNLLDKLKTKGLEDKVNLILLSDHGAANYSAVSPVIYLDKYTNLANIKRFVPFDSLEPAVAGVTPVDGKLDQLYNDLQKIEHAKVYKRDDGSAKDLRYIYKGRVEELIIVAAEGYLVKFDDTPKLYKGYHGWDSNLPDMKPIFYARGPSIRKGVQVEDIRAVDIYALITMLLKMGLDEREGSMARARMVLL